MKVFFVNPWLLLQVCKGVLENFFFFLILLQPLIKDKPLFLIGWQVLGKNCRRVSFLKIFFFSKGRFYSSKTRYTSATLHQAFTMTVIMAAFENYFSDHTLNL